MMKFIQKIMDGLRRVKLWFRSKFKKVSEKIDTVRDEVRKHPFIWLTILFCASAGLNLLVGTWWLGLAVFMVAMILFSSTSVGTGLLKTGTGLADLGYGLVLATGAAVLVAPAQAAWWAWALIPISVLLIKTLKEISLLVTTYNEIEDAVMDLDRETACSGA